jgi:hypothetical protein
MDRHLRIRDLLALLQKNFGTGIAASCKLDSGALSAVGDSIVASAVTAIGRSISPTVFSSFPNPIITPLLRSSSKRESS